MIYIDLIFFYFLKNILPWIILFFIIIIIVNVFIIYDEDKHIQKKNKELEKEKKEERKQKQKELKNMKIKQRVIINNMDEIKEKQKELEKEGKYISEIEKTYKIYWLNNYCTYRINYYYDKNFKLIDYKHSILYLDKKILDIYYNNWTYLKSKLDYDEIILLLCDKNNLLFSNINTDYKNNIPFNMNVNDEYIINLLDVKTNNQTLNKAIRVYKKRYKRFKLKATIKNKYNYILVDDI